MARQAVAGQVKTRLSPQLSPQQSASLYSAFLQDTLRLAASVTEYSSFLACTPDSAPESFARWLPSRIELIVQKGANLGERMSDLLRRLLKEQHSPVVIIGSDIPLLQPATLKP